LGGCGMPTEFMKNPFKIKNQNASELQGRWSVSMAENIFLNGLHCT